MKQALALIADLVEAVQLGKLTAGRQAALELKLRLRLKQLEGERTELVALLGKRERPQLIPALAREFHLPACPGPGVYFLLRDDRLVYIGRSIQPVARIAQHRYQKTFDRVFFLGVPAEDLDAVEGALIRRFRPPGNTRLAGGDQSNDLRVLDKYSLQVLGSDRRNDVAKRAGISG